MSCGKILEKFWEILGNFATIYALSCGEKIATWRNFGKFWRNFGKFWEILRNLGKFCHNFRTFMWRKIEPKSTFVEKNDKYKVCVFIIMVCHLVV